ncbi:DUF72 domain-containing protein [Polluticaenibacter yanchengensis]|uniref:DUF72 domain-containing protein n=1 Tax=Polluticaenibacter yanchengensis TaxID=3014562 RepID=A0ABT4UGL8_9BACT|nr:DUF72 domain-containing protein [Chitinophagaceae bacterium LY-5]
MVYYIGCSGFYYKEWKGIFYPPDLPVKDWFEFYCRYYNTIEINSSFYRTPSLQSLQNWYGRSPDDFLFSIKAPRLITHINKFDMSKDVIDNFCHLISEGLQQKLGNILYQLPPSFTYSPGRLGLICRQLDNGFNNVVEFRHDSWWRQEVFDHFSRNEIHFCGQSYPGNIPAAPVINNHLLYYRFHGKPVLYKSEYQEETLQGFLDDIDKSCDKAFIYFNNTWGHAALVNSCQMQELVSG